MNFSTVKMREKSVSLSAERTNEALCPNFIAFRRTATRCRVSSFRARVRSLLSALTKVLGGRFYIMLSAHTDSHRNWSYARKSQRAALTGCMKALLLLECTSLYRKKGTQVSKPKNAPFVGIHSSSRQKSTFRQESRSFIYYKQSPYCSRVNFSVSSRSPRHSAPARAAKAREVFICRLRHT